MSARQRSPAPLDFCHNPHAASLLQGLQELRSDNLLTDVILCVSGKEIPCHRNVLAACSGYFRAMFCNGHRESQEHKVTIHEVSTNTLQLLIDYAYTSKVTITEENAVKLMQGASFFQIQPVQDACMKFVSANLSAKNCLQMVHMGNMLSCPILEEKAWQYVMTDFAAVSRTAEFLYLTKDQLVNLVSSDDLKAPEESVYKAVMAWVNHDIRKRKKDIKDLMELVRFPFMDKLYFMDNVETNDAMQKSCQDIVKETRRYQLFPGEVQSPRTRPRRSSGLKEAVVVIGGTSTVGNGTGNPPVISNSIMMSCPEELSCWNTPTKMKQNNDSGFAVAVLGTSDIMVSSGRSGKDVWLYQPEMVSWTRLARMNINRYSHKLAVVQGKVYAIGGRTTIFSVLRSVEIYERSQNKWTVGVPLPEGRYGHAVAVLDGNIYVIGGFDAAGEPTATVYCFTPGGSEWQSLRNNMPVRAGNITASVLNGSIYVAGHNEHVLRFKPKRATNSWNFRWTFYEIVATGARPMCGMTVYRGKIYIYGGKDNNKGTSAVMCFDPEEEDEDEEEDEEEETRSLEYVGDMPSHLYGHACVTILKCF